MRIPIFILMFLIISGLIIINNGNLYLTNKEDLNEFSQRYLSWSEGVYQNIRSITGQVINMDWVPNTTLNLTEKGNKTIKENLNNSFEEIVPEEKQDIGFDEKTFFSEDWEDPITQ